MKCARLVILAAVIVVAGFRSLCWSQPEPQKQKANANNFEGKWTELSEERNGEVISLIPYQGPRTPSGFPSDSASLYAIWNISKNTLSTGLHHFAYDLDVDHKDGTIDLFPLDKDGKRSDKGKTFAIYLLKDDYLLICMSWAGNDKRPKAFSTSKENPGNLIVLRRGDLNATLGARTK